MAVVSLNEILSYIRKRGVFTNKDGAIQATNLSSKVLVTTGNYINWLATTGNGAIKVQSQVIALRYSDSTRMYIDHDYAYYGNTITNIASITQTRTTENSVPYHNATWNNYRYKTDKDTESARYRARIYSKMRATGYNSTEGIYDYWRFTTYIKEGSSNTEVKKSDFALRQRDGIIQYFTDTSTFHATNRGYNGAGDGTWRVLAVLFNWRTRESSDSALPILGGVYSTSSYGAGVRIHQVNGVQNFWRANATSIAYGTSTDDGTTVTNAWVLDTNILKKIQYTGARTNYWGIYNGDTSKILVAAHDATDATLYTLFIRNDYIGLQQEPDGGSATVVWRVLPATYMKAVKSSSTATSVTAGTVVKIPIKSSLSSAHSATTECFSIANGGIRILKTGRYKVYGCIYITSSSASVTSKECRIYFGTDTSTMGNNTLIGQARDSGTVSGTVSGSVTTAPNIINVTGTTSYVFLAAYCTGANSTVSESDSGTYLIVEKLS